MTAAAIFAAPFIFGVAVARTIGRDLFQPNSITPAIIIAGLIAAIAWNLITWWTGIPSSASHAMVGGLLGAAVLAEGIGVIRSTGLLKVLASLFISPIAGMAAGWLMMNLIMLLVTDAPPRVNLVFKRALIFTSLALALSYGSNDAQKTMGIITLGLVTAGMLPDFNVPLWVIAASAGAIALGVSLSGLRLIRTLGRRIFKIKPVHAISSQAASAGVILGAALVGGPVSTTHVVSSAIMGAGAAERVKKVRWGVAQQMIAAWILTIPVSFLVGCGVYLVVGLFV
jgi:PiT family inorganic phosphate transporter